MTIRTECRHCTVPVDSGDVCGFCASYRPSPCPHNHPLDCDCPCPALDAVEAGVLLAEVDMLVPTLLASRLASASQCSPAPDGGTICIQSSGPRLTIAVTERDLDTRQLVTREFIAEIREVRA